jgi:hypothetical protein
MELPKVLPKPEPEPEPEYLKYIDERNKRQCIYPRCRQADRCTSGVDRHSHPICFDSIRQGSRNFTISKGTSKLCTPKKQHVETTRRPRTTGFKTRRRPPKPPKGWHVNVDARHTLNDTQPYWLLRLRLTTMQSIQLSKPLTQHFSSCIVLTGSPYDIAVHVCAH